MIASRALFLALLLVSPALAQEAAPDAQPAPAAGAPAAEAPDAGEATAPEPQPAGADEPPPAADDAPAADDGPAAADEAAPTEDPSADDGKKEKEGYASMEGPNQVDRQVALDGEDRPLLEFGLMDPYFAAKKDLSEAIGLTLGGDYTAVFQSATEAPNERYAGSGNVRLWGSWQLVGADDQALSGRLIGKVEHRHRYTDIPASGLSLDLGHVGLINPPFSNQLWRLTNLYWRQSFAQSRFVAYVGFLDSTDTMDAYFLASPWTGFSNLVFSTGSGAVDLPSEAALGLYLGAWITENLYVAGGIYDANSDPHDPFNQILDDAEFFKYIEIGWTSSKAEFFLKRIHFTWWHKDELDDAGAPRGWGVTGSVTWWFADMFLPFLRFGYAYEGGGLLEGSISGGLGIQVSEDGDLAAIAFNWGRPNEEAFGTNDEQYTGEVFYRWKIADNAELTPVISTFIDPALNPDDDLIFVFGIRGRINF